MLLPSVELFLDSRFAELVIDRLFIEELSSLELSTTLEPADSSATTVCSAVLLKETGMMGPSPPINNRRVFGDT